MEKHPIIPKKFNLNQTDGLTDKTYCMHNFFPVITLHFALHTLLISHLSFYVFMVCGEKEDKTLQRERDWETNREIMHGISTLQGGKAYQRLARLHWAAAVA